jgi:hypothetical protein
MLTDTARQLLLRGMAPQMRELQAAGFLSEDEVNLELRRRSERAAEKRAQRVAEAEAA